MEQLVWGILHCSVDTDMLAGQLTGWFGDVYQLQTVLWGNFVVTQVAAEGAEAVQDVAVQADFAIGLAVAGPVHKQHAV